EALPEPGGTEGPGADPLADERGAGPDVGETGRDDPEQGESHEGGARPVEPLPEPRRALHAYTRSPPSLANAEEDADQHERDEEGRGHDVVELRDEGHLEKLLKRRGWDELGRRPGGKERDQARRHAGRPAQEVLQVTLP